MIQNNNGIDADPNKSTSGSGNDITRKPDEITIESVFCDSYEIPPQLPRHVPLDWFEVAIACKYAPAKIKTLIKILQDPYKKPARKQYLLVGAPGAGKTTLAQAIAQAAGLPCIFVPVAELPNEFQNSAAASLQRIINPILQSNERCVIILDEITHITDNYKQKNNSNNDAATATWSLLDRCAQNPNIIIIGTTNDVSDLPAQLKSRFGENGIIEIPLPCEQARSELMSTLLEEWIRDGSLDKRYIDFLVNKTKGKSFRDIMNLLYEAAENAMAEDRRLEQSDIDAIINHWKSWWHPSKLYGSCKQYIKESANLTNFSIGLQIAGLYLHFRQTIFNEYIYEIQHPIRKQK